MNIDVIMKDVRDVVETTLQNIQMPDSVCQPECYIEAITDRIQVIVQPMVDRITSQNRDIIGYQVCIEELEGVVMELQEEAEDRQHEDERKALIYIFNNCQKGGV